MTFDPATLRTCIDLAHLRRLISLVETKRAALPAIDVNDYDSYGRHRVAAERTLDELADSDGARWRSDYAGARFELAGISASSTMGPAMAMANWLVSARRRIRELQAGGAQ